MLCLDATTFVGGYLWHFTKKCNDKYNDIVLLFNAIKVIDPKNLDELKHETATIFCQLEMYFPPLFFDIMVQLIVHLVREIRFCGPIYLRWMYSL